MLPKQNSVKENNILLFHNKNVICRINHSTLPLMISFINLKHKQMFVYQDKKGFVSCSRSEGFKVYVSAHRIMDNKRINNFLKKIRNLIFLIAKNGFEM